MKKLIVYTGIVTSLLFTTGNLAKAQSKISDQGKGAIIGGAGGAVIGGIAGKNVGGAVIGGAIGAGGGYREAYYKKHGHYPNAYVYKKPKN